MLRSTSIKNDQWKPVKLLARQTLDSKVLDSSCSSSGDLVGVLTESDVNIFSNRELIGTINMEGGKSIHVTDCLLYGSPSARDARLSRMPA